MVGSGRTAVIVGGGIAGLTAAASLLRQGWTVTVLEQADRITEVGAGLSITANGLSALASLGIDSAIRDAGHRLYMTGTMDHRGARLIRIPRNSAGEPPQDVYGIHRQQLHKLLRNAADRACLVSGARVISVSPGNPDGARASVQCLEAGGTRNYEAALVVGADGLRSILRSRLAPATVPQYSGKSAWRGIVEDSSLISDDFAVIWGPGTEFGAVRISANQVYWYGYTHFAEGKQWPNEKSAAGSHFSGWAPPVPSLIEATPADGVIRHDVYSLAPRLPTYVYGRTVLIGDAAHAMVPTMGQGANTSLEDGVCVGLLIGRAVNVGTPLATALQHFDAQRRPRTQRIARRSHYAGLLGADVRGQFAVVVRNTLMKVIPGGPAAAAGASILSWKALL
ncbi:FAD-dependent oxidoreductase [Arthrobacter sp. H41]|uniref:FAD-dependent oxidoreductase n=1 Tax=Arthrobacter sp. H41 TaxID=1312978 RepID=UPI00047D099D|nr:FAD-dependent oxidoreductase [Arthrobacter sp. H41]